MKKAWWLCLTLIGLSTLLTLGVHSLSPAQSNQANQVYYDTYERSRYTIHTVTVPHNSNYTVIPALEGELTPLADFATKQQAIAAINGGYFDPKNEKTTSYIVKESRIIADPRLNARLIDNPDLKPYLGKILNRAEFRRYLCASEIRYDIQLHPAPILPNCTLKDVLGGGPGLLPTDTSTAEAFIAYQDGEKIRDAIGSDRPNARSAIGITKKGDIILAMVAQHPNSPLDSGISLPELRDFLASLGVTKAMNLDGGSSASLYYRGNTYYGKVDREGNVIKRSIKSVLLVQDNVAHKDLQPNIEEYK